MTVAIDDLPPLMWSAELGNKLVDVWTGGHHRGVQLNDARESVEQWFNVYGQRCWLRQLTPYATREQEDRLLRVIARMDGTPFPSTARVTGRWFRGRLPTAGDWTRGIPFVDKRVQESSKRRKAEKRKMGLETAYCAETVAITYEEMGFWSLTRTRIGLIPVAFGAATSYRLRAAISSATKSRSWST